MQEYTVQLGLETQNTPEVSLKDFKPLGPYFPNESM